MTDNKEKTNFIKINNDTIININYIQWMKKIGDCMYVCNKVYGCDENNLYGTHKICKNDNYNIYKILEQQYK
jgi:hypothetical protein